jgi:hypothetical protein
VNKVIDKVPQTLIDALNKNRDLYTPSIVYPEIWNKLIEDNPLNLKFWHLLNKKCEKYVLDNSDEDWGRPIYWLYCDFILIVEKAYSGPGKWNSVKKEDRNAKCEDIIKLATELAKKLRGSPFDNDLLNHFHDESYCKEALGNANDSLLSALHTVENSLRFRLLPGETLNFLGVRSPPISDVLISLSEDAKKEMKNKDDVIAKVNAIDSNITYFVRLMSDWCYGHFGTPCHELVSLVADSTYGKRITAENVRNKLKGYSRQVVKNQFNATIQYNNIISQYD